MQQLIEQLADKAQGVSYPKTLGQGSDLHGVAAKLFDLDAGRCKTAALTQNQIHVTWIQIQQDWHQLAAAIPDSILPLYQRLMKTKAGLAVSPMQDGKCGGCHMKLIAFTVAGSL